MAAILAKPGSEFAAAFGMLGSRYDVFSTPEEQAELLRGDPAFLRSYNLLVIESGQGVAELIADSQELQESLREYAAHYRRLYVLNDGAALLEEVFPEMGAFAGPAPSSLAPIAVENLTMHQGNFVPGQDQELVFGEHWYYLAEPSESATVHLRVPAERTSLDVDAPVLVSHRLENFGVLVHSAFDFTEQPQDVAAALMYFLKEL